MTRTARTYLMHLVFVVSMIVCAAVSVRADALIDEAAKTAAEEAGKLIPKDRAERLAVLPIVNDRDGLFQQYLTETVTRRTKFRVIERSALEQILKEQRFQLGDIVDPETRIQPGRINGVEAILNGKVIQADSAMGKASFRAMLRLHDVESGQILWQREVTGAAGHSFLTIILLGMGVLVVLAILMRLLRRNTAPDVGERLQVERDMRDACAREVEKAANYTMAAREKFDGRGQKDLAVGAMNLRAQLLQLRDEIANAASGAVGLTTSEAAQGAIRFDNQFLDQLRPLAEQTEKLLQGATAGASGAAREIEELDKMVLDRRNLLKNRDSHIR